MTTNSPQRPPTADAGDTTLGGIVELSKIAIPTVATMTSYTLMQFIDKLMCSRISEDPIWVGAQGNGGMAAWVPISIVMGGMFVINTFVSQNLGAGKPDKGPAYVWNGLWLCALAYLLLIPYAFLLPQIFTLFGHTERSATLSADYGQILVFGAIISMATRAISQYFYGMHRPGIVLVAGLAGNLTNLALNYCLIYGNFGFPRMELQGAAIATVIGTAVEAAIPFFVFLVPMHKKYATRAQWRPSKSHIKDLFRIGWPGGVMFGNEMVCWAFFMVYLVGSFGPMHSTAGWIAHQWMTLSFMPAVGLSIAVTAAVGKKMGAGRPDLAARRAWTGLAMALIYMGLCGICFFVFRQPMVRLFIEDGTKPDDVELLVALGGKFLIATAAFQLFDAIAMTLSGALRGAGDTVWIGIVTVGLSWGIIVLGGLAFARFYPSIQSLGPWIAAAIYIVALALAILFRFLSGKWKSLKLVTPVAVGH
jgi:multidrug resistance protein, MATE family